MFDTRLVCRKPRLASGCVVASADVISVDSVSADAVAVSAASVTRCLGRFMVVLTEDSGAAADMALLAHGFAPVSPGETGPTHTCSHVPQRPGVQPPPGFALSPRLPSGSPCAAGRATPVVPRCARGRYLTAIENPHIAPAIRGSASRVAGLTSRSTKASQAAHACPPEIERTTSTSRDSSHGECNAAKASPNPT